MPDRLGVRQAAVPTVDHQRSLDRRDRLHRRVWLLGAIAYSVSLSTFVPGGTADGVSLVDVALVSTILLGFVVPSSTSERGMSVWAMAALSWWWLLATLVPFLLDTTTSIAGLARTVLIEAYLVMVLLAVSRVLRYWDPSRRELGLVATVATTAVSAQIIVFSGDATRASGLFPNPNYAGHFLVAFALIAALAHRRVGLIALVVATISVAYTGSFSAYVSLGVGMLGLAAVDVRARVDSRAWAAIAICSAGLILVFAGVRFADAPVTTESVAQLGVDVPRLDQSVESRSQIWDSVVDQAISSGPQGVGAGELRRQRLLPGATEAHSDVLATLAERGVLGLLVLVVAFVAVWRRLSPGARVVLLAVAVAGLSKETLHFRHLPVVLACVLWLGTGRRMD